MDTAAATNGADRPVLLVEDNPEDFEAARRALHEVGCTRELVWFQDGDEALDYLCRRAAFAAPGAAPRPACVLLDLNLPGLSGKEVLAEIRAEPLVRRLPVVIFSTSLADDDVEGCYELGASSYMQKPVNYSRFVDILRSFKEYWVDHSVPPLRGLA